MRIFYTQTPDELLEQGTVLQSFPVESESNQISEEKAAGLHTWLLALQGARLQEPRWDVSSSDRLSSVLSCCCVLSVLF